MSSFLPLDKLQQVVSDYGYWAVGLIVGLESMGIPLPGETILILAAVYAGTTGELNIWGVFGAATAGAIIGDNLGYWLGRRYGYPLLLRYGRYFGMTEGKIKLGQYMFMRHGGKVVFFGRFVAVLRILAAFLAGVNRMKPGGFFLANALGGIVWSAIFAFGGFFFGKAIMLVGRPVAIVGAICAVIGFVGVAWYFHRYEKQLEAEAERAIPGPLMERPRLDAEKSSA